MQGLGSVLDRLQGLFGKGYLIAGFLPALVFLGLNLAVALVISPAARGLVRQFRAQSTADQVYGWLALVFILAILGFILWTLNPWLRLLLQGRLFPHKLQKKMRDSQLEELQQMDRELAALERVLFNLRTALGKDSKAWQKELQKALATPPAASPPDPTPIQRDIDQLDVKIPQVSYATAANDFADLSALYQRVENALKLRPADAASYALQRTFLETAQKLSEQLEKEYQRRFGERHARFPEKDVDLQPTRMANRWQVDSDYAWKRYGMDLEIYWLRMLKLIQGKEGFPLLEERQIQLAFATAMTAVFLLLTLIWWPVTIFGGASRLAYGLAVGIALGMFVIFYQVTAQASAAYGAAVKSAVDLYRFDLLKALGVPSPADSDEEKKLWSTLTAHAELMPADPVVYKAQDEDAKKSVVDHPPAGLWQRFRSALGL